MKHARWQESCRTGGIGITLRHGEKDRMNRKEHIAFMSFLHDSSWPQAILSFLASSVFQRMRNVAISARVSRHRAGHLVKWTCRDGYPLFTPPPHGRVPSLELLSRVTESTSSPPPPIS